METSLTFAFNVFLPWAQYSYTRDDRGGEIFDVRFTLTNLVIRIRTYVLYRLQNYRIK